MRRKGLGASRIASAHLVINAVFNEAVRNKKLAESPCTDIAVPDVVHAADFTLPADAELEALAAGLPADWAATVWLMYGCGLRIGEALAVKTRSRINRGTIVALRSLFRALRQEQVIFRDPTRGISLPALARLPQPLPADHVAGLIDRADGPAARLAVALVAIHAVPVAHLIHLRATDLNLAAGTLTIRQRYRRRIVYLDEVTAALASRWLRYRHHRWPRSRNPHLLVSQQTAVDTSPVGPP